MEMEAMGRVLTEATVENLGDLWDAQRGRIPLEQVRRITVSDALVDTGATMLSLPRRIIRVLGLAKRQTRRVRTSSGMHDADIYDTVRLTIGGRDCPTDVIEVSDETPVLVGQIPLEALDYVVDLRARRLVGNPEHGGELMYYSEGNGAGGKGVAPSCEQHRPGRSGKKGPCPNEAGTVQ